MGLLGILVLLVGIVMIVSCFRICGYAIESARIHLSFNVVGQLIMALFMSLYGFVASIVGLYLIFSREK